METETWNPSAKEVFYPYAVLTSVWGLWPQLEDGLFLRFRVVFSIFLMILGVILASIKLMINCGTADDNTDAILLIAILIIVINKSLFVFIHRDKLRYVLNSAFIDYRSPWSEKDITLSKKYAEFSTTMMKFCSGVSCFTLICYLGKVFIFDQKSFRVIDDTGNATFPDIPRAWVLPGGCILEESSSVLYYFVICIQILELSVLASINTGIDSMFIALSAHVCGQFEILKVQATRIGGKKGLQSYKLLLVQLISRHQHLSILAEYLEACYNNIILVQMLASLMTISTAGFSLLMNLKDKNKMSSLKSMANIQFMLFESYIYTFPSDNLRYQAEGLLNAVYSSHWYTLPAPVMKDIVFMMMRINLPITLTAGKFFYMTRTSYMDVIKTAASYLSVLRLMLED